MNDEYTLQTRGDDLPDNGATDLTDTLTSEPDEVVKKPAAREIIATALAFAGAYACCRFSEGSLAQVAALVLLSIMTFVLHRGEKAAGESWIWLGCAVLCDVGLILRRNDVWELWVEHFAFFIFLTYWMISRGGFLLDGRSGCYLPADCLYGYLVLPLSHFADAFRTLFWAVKYRKRGDRGQISAEAVFVSLFVILIGTILLFAAMRLLASSDFRFAAGLQRLVESLPDVSAWLKPHVLIFAIPLGGYLFGMAAGPISAGEELRLNRRQALDASLANLRLVPAGVWAGLIGAFSAAYLAYFVLQASYLFGGFMGRLPEGFSVAEYARAGFFELCAVMGINFGLLWMIAGLARQPVRAHRPLKIMCLLLLGQSLVFSAIALSKLGMYIGVYGFTPLRLQSTWLACVLMAGCVCGVVHICTGRKTFRAFMAFGAVTMAALCLV
ncbi:MAG: DUF4173 domain-containing protein [Clostridia bacterium]|nr:DUF4173 domain-containing protein [Clostridia bacterium]